VIEFDGDDTFYGLVDGYVKSAYQNLFCHRTAFYALQQADGSYSRRRSAVNAGVVKSHLQGASLQDGIA
jgi:hypothetical protein